MTDRTDTVVADTRRWLERAVIGLNLCPFAKSVHVKGQVHYAVSAATGGARCGTTCCANFAISLPSTPRCATRPC
jgi:hypothetical protein